MEEGGGGVGEGMQDAQSQFIALFDCSVATCGSISKEKDGKQINEFLKKKLFKDLKVV